MTGEACFLVRQALRGWQTLAGGRIGAKVVKPKGYEPIPPYRNPSNAARLSGSRSHVSLCTAGEYFRGRWMCGVRREGVAFSGRKAHREQTDARCVSWGGAHMNNLTATLAIRARLRQQTLPYGALWRRARFEV
jgi:hypothetical protein